MRCVGQPGRSIACGASRRGGCRGSSAATRCGPRGLGRGAGTSSATAASSPTPRCGARWRGVARRGASELPADASSSTRRARRRHAAALDAATRARRSARARRRTGAGPRRRPARLGPVAARRRASTGTATSRSASAWPRDVLADDQDGLRLDEPCDIKVPWELSRCHHWVTLGRAYALEADPRYAARIRRPACAPGSTTTRGRTASTGAGRWRWRSARSTGCGRPRCSPTRPSSPRRSGSAF